MVQPHPLLAKIEAYLSRTGAAPSMFGDRATSDPNFVFDLRRGREPRRALVARVERFMREHRSGLPPERVPRERGAQDEGAAA